MDNRGYLDVVKYYEVPELFYHLVKVMLTEDEIRLISLMKKNQFTYSGLIEFIHENFDRDSSLFLKNCYKRAVIKKIEKHKKTYYTTDTFYTRLSYFAQYELDKWQGVAEDDRKKLDVWCFGTYVDKIRGTIEKKIRGKNIPLHNSDIITLKKAQEMIDSMEKEIYLQPCNCRSIAQACDKPKNVCIQFGCENNTPADRGWGEQLTKEQAKQILKEANKQGLIHSGEEEALCNCDRCCCYPFRAAEILGSKKIWPKTEYVIQWDEASCIHCKKCIKICNFGAFYSLKENEVKFDREKCWACTICAENCPKHAIAYYKATDVIL
ncbi:ATP-binding protein [Clostridium aceticum]|nr:4Fe-4S binding protein [Clostridium aceticum]KJF26307.1 hypothetical protein TZ02_14150 [Clostridium aceticum]